MNTEIKRIYHPYNLWEDYEAGFYNNCSGVDEKQKIEKAIKMFNSEYHTRRCMYLVIEKWKNSCEHNLTNNGLNKIAYIGQAACCIYGGIPSSTTMKVWSMLTSDVQKRSDEIAKEVIRKWINNNKNIQLCLNIT